MDISKRRMLKHLPQLRRYARALTGDAQQGDALTNKTMDCAASLISFIPKDLTMPVWLFSVMHNLTVDFFSEFYENVSSQSILPYISAEDLDASNDDPNFDIKGALAHLTLEQKETVLLTSLEKLNYREVCQVMGFNDSKLINCLDSARDIMCNYLFRDQFEDLQQVQ